ncbi:ArfGAP with FG repeats 1 [Actinomortierella ambigua]|nr:ArfGAP with FG repeats 1 [Actinomortierella ambigua]
MSKRIDERHSRILASLLKLSENKKCFDCSSKVNVYANLFNSTFICERCSGLHRELNHRVKSISASTFSPDEIAALQKGGNGVAKTIWLATWSWKEYPEPDSNDNDEVRQFMRAKYVKRLWHVEGNSTSTSSASSKDTTPRPSTASSAARPSNFSASSSAQASPSSTRAGASSTNPPDKAKEALTMNIAGPLLVGGTGVSISERTLSRKSSTLSTDSGSTNLSKSTDPSSAGSSPFHPATGNKSMSTSHHQQFPSSNLGQYSFSHFQQTLVSTPTPSGHAVDEDPFSLMQASFANMQMSSGGSQQHQPPQQQAPAPTRSYIAPVPSSNQFGSFADFESAFSSTSSHQPPASSMAASSNCENEFFAAFGSTPFSSAPTSTASTTTPTSAAMTSIPRGNSSPSPATTPAAVAATGAYGSSATLQGHTTAAGLVASPSMLSPLPMHSSSQPSVNDYFGTGAIQSSATVTSGARSFDDFLSSMSGASSSASARAATISDSSNPFGLAARDPSLTVGSGMGVGTGGIHNYSASALTQPPPALQRAHTSAYPSTAGGGSGGGGSTNPFAAFAKSSSLSTSNTELSSDPFGHASRGMNMSSSSVSSGLSAPNPFSSASTTPSSLSNSSSALFQSQQAPNSSYHTKAMSLTTQTTATSAGSDWATSAFSSPTLSSTSNNSMPSMLTRATTEPTVSHFATGHGAFAGHTTAASKGAGTPAAVEDVFGTWASKSGGPMSSMSNNTAANAFGLSDLDPFGFQAHSHNHNHYHQHAASASTNPFGL